MTEHRQATEIFGGGLDEVTRAILDEFMRTHPQIAETEIVVQLPYKEGDPFRAIEEP